METTAETTRALTSIHDSTLPRLEDVELTEVIHLLDTESTLALEVRPSLV